MHFTCRSFIGKTNPHFWSQYWENEPDDPAVVSSKGHFFGLIGLQSDLGRTIIEDLTTTYYSSASNISGSILEAVKSVNLPPSATLLICVIEFPQVYLYSFGPDHVYLLRQNQFSRLINGPTVTVLTGQAEINDKFLLISNLFNESLTADNIKNYLNLPVNNLEENISSHLMAVPSQDGFSALFLQIQPDVGQVEFISPPKITPTIPVFTPKTEPQYLQHSDINQVAKRKKISLIIAIIILFLLAGSVFYSFRRNRRLQLENQFQTLKTSLEQKIADAKIVKNLNLDASLKAGEEAKVIYQQLTTLKIHSDLIQPFDGQIQQLLSQSGSDEYFPGKDPYDTALISKSPSYSRIYLLDSKLYLLDIQKGRIDELDVIQKSIHNLSQSDALKSARKLVVDQNNLFVLTDNQLNQISSSGAVKTIEFNNSKNNFTVNDIAVWNGSFYLLSSDNIYKLALTPEGFSAPRAWLKDSQSLPQNPVSLAINGRIWVLSGAGQLIPYNLGTKENYKTEFSPNFTKVHNLVTTATQDTLAFIDGDSLIYVFQKDGGGLAKYNFGDKKVLDIAYDPTQKLIFALCSDQIIYKVSL